jgi:hypothetical protein
MPPKPTGTQRYRDVLDYEIGARIVVEFAVDRREIMDYSVVLAVDVRTAERTLYACTTAHTGSTRCIGTTEPARRRQRRRSMRVPLEKVCEPRSLRFVLATRR